MPHISFISDDTAAVRTRFRGKSTACGAGIGGEGTRAMVGAAGGTADMVVSGAGDGLVGVVSGAVYYFVLSRPKKEIGIFQKV